MPSPKYISNELHDFTHSYSSEVGLLLDTLNQNLHLERVGSVVSGSIQVNYEEWTQQKTVSIECRKKIENLSLTFDNRDQSDFEVEFSIVEDYVRVWKKLVKIDRWMQSHWICPDEPYRIIITRTPIPVPSTYFTFNGQPLDLDE